MLLKKYDRPSDTWVDHKFEDTRVGDIVWGVDADNVSHVLLAAADYDSYTGSFDCDWKIDPATNTWVPYVSIL